MNRVLDLTAPSAEPEACPDCESENPGVRGIIPVPSGGRWGYHERECESEWHDSAAPSGEQREEGQR